MIILAAQPPNLPESHTSIKCWRKPTNYKSKEREKGREYKLGDDDAPLQQMQKNDRCALQPPSLSRSLRFLPNPAFRHPSFPHSPALSPPSILSVRSAYLRVCQWDLYCAIERFRSFGGSKNSSGQKFLSLNIQVLVRKTEASIALIRRSLEQFFFSKLYYGKNQWNFQIRKVGFCAQKQFMFAFVKGTFNFSSKRAVS